jgi:hypothetical protein
MSTPADRTPDARLARLHLRGGLLSLARAELEQMAGAGTLDREALADLAEARWRTGDLEGASEAALAHVGAGGDEPMAVLVAAEQAEREGRILDAQRGVARVVGRVGSGVERLFAGEARGTVWPAPLIGWMDTGASAPGRWGLLVGGAEVADPDTQTWPAAAPPVDEARPASIGQARPAEIAARGNGGPTDRTGAQLGFIAPGASTRQLLDAGLAAGRELEVVDRDVAAGATGDAAARLALILRLDSALAPIVLSAADRALRVAADAASRASLEMVRGDAYRWMGREVEAVEAYEQAQRILSGRPPTQP